ncbi:hypothetical protein IMSHALPRED_000934 [Imshaugia aleurites]|uniref:Uncharacterized protein n=1 Tax=Imshaugia aleurites TaxID=172621 RepID=A0A8H3EZJ6_9LECA|nr:hypothetical protein IMSHALPRED_000934 [Imshaugia aleurites]
MSFSGTADEGVRATRSSEATESSTPNSSTVKVQTAWQTVKTNFKSMPDLRRWLPSPRASESNNQVKEHHPEDEGQSLFCESLLGLMQRTGKFDYLDYSKDTSKQKEEGNIEAAEKDKAKDLRRSLKRFSWSR